LEKLQDEVMEEKTSEEHVEQNPELEPEAYKPQELVSQKVQKRPGSL